MSNFKACSVRLITAWLGPGTQAAEQTPLTALKVGELALEAGIPAGVLNVLAGGPFKLLCFTLLLCYRQIAHLFPVNDGNMKRGQLPKATPCFEDGHLELAIRCSGFDQSVQYVLPTISAGYGPTAGAAISSHPDVDKVSIAGWDSWLILGRAD
jgi:Aldehyde dehydrogenase family